MRFSKLLIGFVVSVLLLLQWAFWFGKGGMLEWWQLRQREQEFAAQNMQMAKQNQRLAAEVSDLQRGTAAMEELARNRFGLIRPGETFYQLITPEKPLSK